MDILLHEILEAADKAVDERWHEVGEVTDETMARLRELMERYHAKSGAGKGGAK